MTKDVDRILAQSLCERYGGYCVSDYQHIASCSTGLWVEL